MAIYDKKNEFGRSMVEMLGTLAIIGVLSIGGIAGYSYGMDKYRANTIINDVMLRAIDVTAQFDTTGDTNLSAWPTITANKYPIRIQVDGLPKRLCQMVFDGIINNATIKIVTTEYNSPTDNICGQNNTMVFYVDNNTSSTETNKQTDKETTTVTEENPLPVIPYQNEPGCPPAHSDPYTKEGYYYAQKLYGGGCIQVPCIALWSSNISQFVWSCPEVPPLDSGDAACPPPDYDPITRKGAEYYWNRAGDTCIPSYCDALFDVNSQTFVWICEI